jgi:hypothetical protein
MTNDLYLKKRTEDIGFALKFLQEQGFEIHEYFAEKKNYFSCCWLLVESPKTSPNKLLQFKEKTLAFFERNLVKKNISDFIVSFYPEGVFTEKKEEILISLLLLSPAAQIFIFSKYINHNHLDVESIGKAKIYWFPPILETLARSSVRKEFAVNLIKATKKTKP